MIDPRCGGFRQRRLGVKSHAQARFRDHVEIVGAVAGRHRVLAPEAQPLAQLDKVARLASRPKIGSSTRPGQMPVRIELEPVGAHLVEADHLGDLLRRTA